MGMQDDVVKGGQYGGAVQRMHSTPRVRDLMTDTVEVLQLGDTVETALRLMRLGHIHHLPVIDDDERVIGLVTQRTLAGGMSDVPVDMIMRKEVSTIEPDAPASAAARLLEAQRYGCLPVVGDGKLVGIITKGDFVRYTRVWLEQEG